jgi:Dockerin type I domain/Protein of unknown function (DUF1565)
MLQQSVRGRALGIMVWAIVAVAAQTAVAARPVARWDVVPDQRLGETFNVGVCAFHTEGVKVEFRVGGTLVHTALNPTLNPRTNVWEFSFPLDPSGYPDGPLTIDARAIPLAAGHASYDLPALALYANSGGSLTVSTVKWVDASAGSDSNPGTEAQPYKTLAKAVQNTPAGGAIYLKAGSYSSNALGGGSARSYWTTISAAPGVARDDVEVGQGRPGTQRLKWTDLTVFADYTGGYYTILAGENGSHLVWLDDVKVWNKQGRWAASAITFGNRYVSYVTGGLTTEMANGPGGSIIRNHTMTRITSDAWTGGGRLVVNSSVADIDPDATGAHPDFHQSYCVAPDWVENVILYNVRGTECISQGLFGSRLRHSAFVNVMIEKVNTVMVSQYSGPMENVLFLHMNIIDQTWLWRGTGTNAYSATEVKVANNIFQAMSLTEDATAVGLTLDHNHFVDPSRTMGTDVTTGSVHYVDPSTNDYRIADTSPAYATGRTLQCVPADIDGDPFDPVNRNRGCHARGGVALDNLDRWQLTATHGPAGSQERTVADGDVHSSVATITALRAFANVAIDPATLTPGSVTLSGQTTGDQTGLVQSLTLEDAGATIVITLSATLPDADRYTVKTTGGAALEGDTDLELGVLAGDVNASGTVSQADIVATRNQTGNTLNDTTAACDVDASGTITGADMAAVRDRLGHALP